MARARGPVGPMAYKNRIGHEIISEDNLIKELKDYRDWCRKVGRDFLGLKNFLYNWIASKDYDIGKAWDIIESLEERGVLKIDIWKDKNEVYPDQKMIVILKDLM